MFRYSRHTDDVSNPDDRVALVATPPLTDNETWTPLPVKVQIAAHAAREF